jgi:hypothetical protein
MPDPETPNADTLNETADAANRTADSLNKVKNASIESKAGLNDLDGVLSGVGSTLNSLGDKFANVGISINNMKALTGSQTEQFGLLSAAVLGARKSFDTFAHIDVSGLNTFNDQFKQLKETINASPTATLAKNMAEAFGIQIPKSKLAEGASAIKKFVVDAAQSLLTGADNALRLQNAYLQLGGKTGSLGTAFDLAGPKLENLNALLEKQSKMMAMSEKATGALPETVQKYYSSLGTVPGALESLVVGSGDADTRVSMLTATMKVATGTGRAYEDVVDDLKIAFRNYGLVGENALKFSTQMSAVSQNLGVELDTVKKALQGTSDVFKMFGGTQAEAAKRSTDLAETLNKYSAALSKSGLSGTQSIEVVKGMVSQLSQLTTAQKAFLSAQTGGPGGLMGALQMDKLIQTNPAAAFEKVRQQMKQQMGRIVTQDEGMQSQGAAAENQRQMLLLRQGPLGQFAKTDAEAQRILEGFKAREEGTVSEKGLSDRIVQESMDKGTVIQEKSYTVLNAIRADISAIRSAANISNLGLVQKGMTAGAGTPLGGQTTEASRNLAAGLKSSMSGSANMLTPDTEESYAAAVRNKKLVDSTGRSAVAAINNLQNSFALVPDAIKAPAEALKKAFTSGDTKSAVSNISLFENNIKKLKSDISKMPVDQRAAAMEELKKEQAVVDKAKAALAAAQQAAPTASLNLAGATAGRGTAIPANRLATAAARVPGVIGNAAGAAAPAAAVVGATGTPTTEVSQSEVTVKVTGFCLRCKNEMDGGDQAKATNKVSKTT